MPPDSRLVSRAPRPSRCSPASCTGCWRSGERPVRDPFEEDGGEFAEEHQNQRHIEQPVADWVERIRTVERTSQASTSGAASPVMARKEKKSAVVE